MQILIGLENGNEGRSIAWAFEHPGCYAYGKAGSDAVVNIPRALLAYQSWLERHTPAAWLSDLGDFDVRLAEVFECYTIDDNYNLTQGAGYEVNAFFRHDWKPLTALEIERGLQLLAWSRADLLALVNGLAPAQLDAEHPGERWSIRGILAHTASAEWWYLDRLGLTTTPRATLPKDPCERLDFVRQQLNAALPGQAGVEKVLGLDGELWSARKLLRRALWHERDHTEHILKLSLE